MSELLSIRDTLSVLLVLADAIEGTKPAGSPLVEAVLRPDRDVAADLRTDLASALAENLSKTITQDGLFQIGYDDELGDLIECHEPAKSWLGTPADREKRDYGLSYVTADHNKTDGCYI